MRKKLDIVPLPPPPGARKLYILLTRFPSGGARAISFLTRSYYTHASIGLEEDMNTFYSFVCKGYWRPRCEGFLVEKIDRYNRPDRPPYPCRLYELSVSDEAYEATRRLLAHFAAHKEIYRYARFGVLCGLFRIPFKTRRHYFCSQFVAEVIKRTAAGSLKKRACLYMPGDFHRLPGASLVFQGDLDGLAKAYALPPQKG